MKYCRKAGICDAGVYPGLPAGVRQAGKSGHTVGLMKTAGMRRS